MYKCEILFEVDPIKWNNTLLNSSHSTFFQSTYNLKKTSRSIPAFIYVYDDEKKVVGQLGFKIIKTAENYASPLLIKLLRLISTFTKRVVWIDGPIIYSNDMNEKKQILDCIIKELKLFFKKNRIVLVYGYTPSLENSHLELLKSRFQNANYKTQEYVTFLADLSLSID